MPASLRCEHLFPAFVKPDSAILILGSFPSVKSREREFYYAHPQNRFWKVLAGIYGEKTPGELAEKKIFLEAHKLALWDVIESCEVTGSSDASIKNVLPTDIESLVGGSRIRKIILNGRTAEKYFKRFHPDFPLPVFALPSTSPANAAYSLERLVGEWKGYFV